MSGFFFLKKFLRCPCIDFAFFVEKSTASLLAVLAPTEKIGFFVFSARRKSARRAASGNPTMLS